MLLHLFRVFERSVVAAVWYILMSDWLNITLFQINIQHYWFFVCVLLVHCNGHVYKENLHIMLVVTFIANDGEFFSCMYLNISLWLKWKCVKLFFFWIKRIYFHMWNVIPTQKLGMMDGQYLSHNCQKYFFYKLIIYFW